MLPLGALSVWLELLLLAASVLPFGALVLRFGERLLGRKVALPPVERALLALYVSGGVLFVLASLSIPIYGTFLLLALFVGGGVVYAVMCFRERAVGPRSVLAFARTPPGIILGVLAAGVLAVEVAGVDSLILPNMLDGSLHSLFVNLLVSDHTLPWTLGPYAAMGVTYPQGAPVWMSVPVVLFGWPTVSAPLDLPPLFLAASAPAAFCLGRRWSKGFTAIPEGWAALLFAAFFGLVVSWPRLEIGGSFDFAFGLPLFLLLLGWFVPFVQSANVGWGGILAFATVVGIEFSLSLTLGFTTLFLLIGYILAFRTRDGPRPHLWIARWLTIAGISAGFLVRSVIGFVAWFEYPAHVLVPTGNAPLPPGQVAQSLSYGYVNGELNPFVLFKPKLSPVPLLSVEIMVLLAAGIVLIGLTLAMPRNPLRKFLPRTMLLPIVVGAILAFVETGALLLADAANLSPGGLSSVTDVEEVSVVLFVFYELIAIVPLVAAAAFLSSPPQSAPTPRPRGRGRTDPNIEPSGSRGVSSATPALIVLVLLVPLASGCGVTAAVLPGYISDHIHQLANVSTSDISALEWAGAHLPACSRVLVAPGSVGQYLPEFAAVSILYPVFPSPENLSYELVVNDLVSGVYNSSTREGMDLLAVSEVFVSGQNSVTYLPFQPGPMMGSPDFEVLLTEGDVTILEFVPGATSAGCTA